MDRNDRFSLKNPDPFFSREKKCQDIFWPEKKVPARAIRIKKKKFGNAGKFTSELKNDSKLYIRLSDNYPIIGSLTYHSFSREKKMPDILQELLAKPFGRMIACVHCGGIPGELSGITRFPGRNTDLPAPGKIYPKKRYSGRVFTRGPRHDPAQD